MGCHQKTAQEKAREEVGKIVAKSKQDAEAQKKKTDSLMKVINSGR